MYEAPRELIGAAGANLTEMPRHADRSFCCGAGGARMWMEEHIGKRINHERVDEALATGAATIATACPFCRVMVTDGVNDRQEEAGRSGVEVLDVAQILLGSLEYDKATLPEKGTAAKEAEGRKARRQSTQGRRTGRTGRGAGRRSARGARKAGEPPARRRTRQGAGYRRRRQAARRQEGGTAEAKAAEAPAAAAPAKGLGIAGGAKKPGAKKAAPAEATEATEAPEATEANRRPPHPPLQSKAWAWPPAPSDPAPRRPDPRGPRR